MFKQILFILFLGIYNLMSAQYLNEIGIFGGGSNYSGDIGNETYIKPNSPAGGIIYKRNLNERISLRGTFSLYNITDNDANSFNPKRQLRGYSFSNTISEVALGVELNYFDYDITSHDNTYTPYLFFEVAGFHYYFINSIDGATYNYASKVGYAIPLGIGFKSRISRRVSYAVELRARYALADDLDYNNENYQSLRFGNPNTNDWYFFSGIGITYSFGRPPCAVEPQY